MRTPVLRIARAIIHIAPAGLAKRRVLAHRRFIMRWQDYIIAAGRLWPGAASATGGPGAPLALVDLDATRAWPDRVALPACPVIGYGDPAHPLGPHLDAVIVPPVGVDALARAVLANPLAAAVVTDLLRTLPAQGPQAGLIAESLAYAALQGGAEHRAWLTRRPPAAGQAPGRLDLVRADATLTVTLDRPHADNAIDRPLRDALAEAFQLAALDPTIATIRLAARGKAFSLGADLAEFGTTTDPALAHSIRRQTLPARFIAEVADRLETHVRGGCVGAGLEMAAWSRRLTASPRAWFQLPELAMGVLPGAGGCVALTRRIGRQKAALLILSGRRLSARAALEWGLVDALVDDVAAEEGHPHIAG